MVLASSAATSACRLPLASISVVRRPCLQFFVAVHCVALVHEPPYGQQVPCQCSTAAVQVLCLKVELVFASPFLSLAQAPATYSRAAVTEAVSVFCSSCFSVKRSWSSTVVHQPHAARDDGFQSFLQDTKVCSRDTGSAFKSLQDVFPQNALPRGFFWEDSVMKLAIPAGNVRPARRRLSAHCRSPALLACFGVCEERFNVNCLRSRDKSCFCRAALRACSFGFRVGGCCLPSWPSRRKSHGLRSDGLACFCVARSRKAQVLAVNESQGCEVLHTCLERLRVRPLVPALAIREKPRAHIASANRMHRPKIRAPCFLRVRVGRCRWPWRLRCKKPRMQTSPSPALPSSASASPAGERKF